MLRIMMLLAKPRNDAMFAHYATRRNIIHTVNITAVGNVGEVFAIAKVKLHREPPKLILRFGEPRFSEVCTTHK